MTKEGETVPTSKSSMTVSGALGLLLKLDRAFDGVVGIVRVEVYNIVW